MFTGPMAENDATPNTSLFRQYHGATDPANTSTKRTAATNARPKKNSCRMRTRKNNPANTAAIHATYKNTGRVSAATPKSAPAPAAYATRCGDESHRTMKNIPPKNTGTNNPSVPMSTV